MVMQKLTLLTSLLWFLFVIPVHAEEEKKPLRSLNISLSIDSEAKTFFTSSDNILEHDEVKENGFSALQNAATNYETLCTSPVKTEATA